MSEQTFVRPLRGSFDGQFGPALTRGRGQTLSEAPLDLTRVAVFIALNVGMALIISKSPPVATAHALVLLTVGLVWALAQPGLERAAYLCAYISGSETLWRMSKADLPWETGKYAVCLVLVLSMIRNGRLGFKILPALSFLLLLPALIMPMTNVGFDELRKQISFNLSGPLALTVCVWFFSQMRLTTAQLHRIYLGFLGPTIGIGAVALMGIVTAKNLIFYEESNASLSGGFGPTHVSSILGCGAVFCFLWAMNHGVVTRLRALLFALMVYLIGQCMITFSRGGLYMAGAALAVATFFLLQDRRARAKLLSAIGALLLIANFVILPQLDDFTGGAMSKRLADTSSTGRDSIAMGDLQVFWEHPLFGVGPGQTRHFRPHDNHYSGATAHTEFTRLLSEHGIFGILAIVVLMAMGWRQFRKARSPGSRAMTFSLLVWCALFFASLATRLVLTSFLFGLTAVALAEDDEPTGDLPLNGAPPVPAGDNIVRPWVVQ